MKTEIIDLDKNIDCNIYQKLKKYYKDGKLVAIPTETVYGLSADATNKEAITKIYEAKGRPSDNPLIVHFYSLEQIESIVDISDFRVQKLIKNFWPGPMTLILNIINKNIIADNVTAGLSTLAIRMPGDKYARKILKETNILLAAPSANTSGKPSPTRFEHVYNDLNNKIDFIVKGDKSSIGLESTVIDCTREKFVIARPGSISKEQIEKVIGVGNVEYVKKTEITKPISPGMKYRHYSPNGDFYIYSGTLDELLKELCSKGKNYGLITYEKYRKKLQNLDINIKYLAYDEKDIENANKNIYNILREYDLENVEKIYILRLEENESNKALINRLEKASSKK